MLSLVLENNKINVAEALLKRKLKAALNCEGTRNIGFQGGNVDRTVYSNGDGTLWVAFSRPSGISGVLRHWNAFGIYHPDWPAQRIIVEINIAIGSNNAQIAGFFAEDSDTGEIFLMHSGRIGGGRPGIGKSAFLVWSKAKREEVKEQNGAIRLGIAVGKLNDPDLASRIQNFVRVVQSFKNEAASGKLGTPEFKRRIAEFDKYSKEYSGTKKGIRGGAFEYVTYHGDIVQKLFDNRSSRLSRGEAVFNSQLIDLFVKKDGIISEVYEVKTTIGRQVLYTAIGQLVTHASLARADVAKFLVVPDDESIPKDFAEAIAALGIQLRRFRLTRTDRNRVVELDSN
jgi:hypothetical protein